MALIVIVVQSLAQSSEKDLKISLNDDGSHYVRGTGLAQIWMRYVDYNPGSTVFGTAKNGGFDVGLRRVRYQVFGQITDQIFIYTQFGINSWGSTSARKPGMFLHDVTAEYAVIKTKLSLGAGLNGWNGTSRYSSSSVGSILGMDLPYFQETTNDLTDQFVRRLGVYAKGKLGSFDYRISASNPMPIQTAAGPVPTLPEDVTKVAYYSAEAPAMQFQGYFMWQFWDKESNQFPYMTGSYLGTKKVLSLGSGFAVQDHAVEYRDVSTGPVLQQASKQFGIDVFLENPLNKEKGNSITAYVAFLKYDFGPNHLHNTGPMNPANGVNDQGTFNGPGNNAPLIGTGTVYYGQAGYLMRKDLLGKLGTLQPYLELNISDFQRVENSITTYNIGVNWIQMGHRSKLSLDYQSRPILVQGTNELLVINESAKRKGQFVLQYQFAF